MFRRSRPSDISDSITAGIRGQVVRLPCGRTKIAANAREVAPCSDHAHKRTRHLDHQGNAGWLSNKRESNAPRLSSRRRKAWWKGERDPALPDTLAPACVRSGRVTHSPKTVWNYENRTQAFARSPENRAVAQSLFRLLWIRVSVCATVQRNSRNHRQSAKW